MHFWRQTLLSLCAIWLICPSSLAEVLTCPPPSALVRDPKTLLWSTPRGDWKSYAPSFSKHASAFAGAQWQGVKVGNLFCLYQGDAMTFTLSLQFYALTEEPNTGKWETNVNGIRNCHAATPEDCPFVPVSQPQQLDIQQELQQIKVNSPSDSLSN